ncbi:MAG TPA: ArsI/CadI family heavy metal resistance metalloenzyme [Terriglobales bacterium]|nr:ArsI/CadI family heavy metal resistance metalloenzyme [Terriglobales bacterium]
MKLHLSLDVHSLAESVTFYSALFGTAPAKLKAGYAKFDLDEPAVVLAMQQKPGVQPAGINHLGLRVHSTAEVLAARERLRAQGLETTDELGTVCCYAAQDKIWVTDPSGYRWEIYFFKGDVEEAFNDVHRAIANKIGCSCEEQPAKVEAGCC